MYQYEYYMWGYWKLILQNFFKILLTAVNIAMLSGSHLQLKLCSFISQIVVVWITLQDLVYNCLQYCFSYKNS